MRCFFQVFYQHPHYSSVYTLHEFGSQLWSHPWYERTRSSAGLQGWTELPGAKRAGSGSRTRALTCKSTFVTAKSSGTVRMVY
jgi:hypothetical protein